MSTLNDKKNIVKTIQDILSPEDVDTAAQNYTNDKSVRVLDYQIEDYWRKKVGYLKPYKSIKITLQKSNSNNPETISLFLKLVPYDCKSIRNYLIEDGIFLKESNFYNKVHPHLSENSNYEKWFPTSFLLKDDAIILEDLKCDGYRVLGNKLLDNTAALKSALVSVARLHGSSIIMENRLNRNSKHPITLNEYYADVLYERIFVHTECMKRFLSNSIDVSCALAKNLGYDPETIRKAYDKVFDMVKPSKTYCNVICHGDLWSNNLMFSDDSAPYNCILIDFQMTRYAPIALDLLLLLHLNTSRRFRKKNEKDLVIFYHSVLEKTVRDDDTDAKVPTIEEIFAGMDDFRLFGLVITALYYPFVLIDPIDLAKYTKDSDSYHRLIFGDRVDLTLAYMKKNESYKIKNEESIVDLAEKIMSIHRKNQQFIADAIKNTVTPEDVTVVAQRYTNDKYIQVLDYVISDYSKERLGFLASHKILTTKFQRSNASETESASFFVKSVPYGVQIQVDLLMGAGIFLKETEFFRQVIPQLIENYKYEQWYPECYLAKKDAIILEDLKSQGYSMINPTDNIVALKSILVSLARFHSCSILLEDRINRNSENQMTLNEYYSDVFHETFFVTTGVGAVCVASIFESTCAVAKSYGYNPDKYRKNSYRVYEMIKESKTHRNVFCHGDLWCNNLMFDENYKCIFVDFQHVRYAPLVAELLQFIHLNCTRKFRKNHEKELIEFYYSILEKTIKDSDTTGCVKVPTLKEIFSGMDDLRLIGLVTACCYFPISLIDSKTVTKYVRDGPDSYKNFILGDKVDLVLDYMKINESYKTRLEEAVIELAEHIDLFYE